MSASPCACSSIEDNEDDAALIVRLLRRSGYEPDWQRVETAEALDRALAQGHWDVVLSDYTMPQFDGLRASARPARAIRSFLPFIIISGSIGEETAVAAMRAGASDYLMKSNLTRLVPAIERELRESAERRERARTKRALLELQEKFEAVFREYLDVMLVLDAVNGDIQHVNQRGHRRDGLRRAPLADWAELRDFLAPGPTADGPCGGGPGPHGGIGFPLGVVRAARRFGVPDGSAGEPRALGADGGDHRDLARRDRAPPGPAAAGRGRRNNSPPTLRSIGEAVATTDVRGCLSLLNGVAEELTGWTQAEAVGRPLEEVLQMRGGPGDRPRGEEITGVLRRGGVVEISRNVTAALAPRAGVRGGADRRADPASRRRPDQRPGDGVPRHRPREQKARGRTPESFQAGERRPARRRHRA